MSAALPTSTTTTADGLMTSLDKYPSCVEWLETLNSDYTKSHYTYNMVRFLAFVNSDRQNSQLSPDDLLKIDNQQLKELLQKYLLHLKRNAKPTVGKAKKGEISVNSVSSYFPGIKSFLDYNEIPTVWWKKLKKMMPKKVKNTLRSYSLEEIEKMMYYGDVFDKANILCFASGGMRVGGQEGLVVGNIKRLPEGMGLLHVYPDSQESHYVVPLTAETLHYIDKMLEYRRQKGEKITDQSALFRDKFAPLSRKTNRPHAVGRRGIRRRMVKLMERAGLPRDVLQPDHSFRYFFNTALMNSDCKREFKELMMGHSLKLDDVYYDEDNEKGRQKILVEYMKAMDSLTITPQFRMTKRIAQLEREVAETPKLKEMESTISSLFAQGVVKDKKLEETEKRLADMEESNKKRDEADKMRDDLLRQLLKKEIGPPIEG